MVKKTLVTTGLKKIFPKKFTDNFIFLGKWCYIGVNQEVYKKCIFHNYHWDDRDKLYNDYKYLNDLYEKILPVLSNKLNSLNNVNYSIDYWRILIGPWLAYFTQIFYDRYETINSLQKSNIKIDETNVVIFKDKDMIPLDMKEFINFFIDDPWNHYIFGYIISHISNIKINYVNSFFFKFNISKYLNNLLIKLNNTFKINRKVSSKEKNQVFFLSTYLSKNQETHLFKKLNNNNNTWEKIHINTNKPKNQNRNWSINFETNSEFEDLLIKILPKQIPFLYLEKYSYLTQVVKNSNWPENPRTIFTSNAFESDDCFKHYTGLQKQNHTKIIIGQHGGHYGTGKWNCSEEHELKISNTYLSWGWENSIYKNIYPIGKIKFQTPISFKKKKSKILLINVVLPRYSYQMYSVFVSSQYLYYLQNQFDFVDNINESVKTNLKIRLFPSKSSKWLQKERWVAYNPNLKFDTFKNINTSYADAKLVVVTFNATVFLETFNLNIPTVIFWDPIFWEIRDSAVDSYNSLIKVGVLHYDSISASKHVNKIWDNVEDWWNSNDVQDAILNFKNKYVKSNQNILNDLFTVLN
jgi:putative transferase (TIGR04331 family)